MGRSFPITASLVALATLGCTLPPKPNSDVAAAPSPNRIVQPRSVAMRAVEREGFSRPSFSGGTPVRQVSYTSAVNDSPQGAALGPDATLDELIAFATANHPEIQAVQMQARALLARVPQVQALDDPMLIATAFLDPIQTAAGPQDVILSLSQKFPWFGKRAWRGNAAYQEAQAAFARTAAAELAVVEQVKLAYYDLYYLDRAIDVNDELASRLEDVIEIATAKYETASEKTGLETVLQAQVELAQLRTMLVQFEQAKEQATARLAKALHAPPGVSLELTAAIPPRDVPHSADVLVGLIDQCQPELEAVRREIDRDQAAIELAGRNYYPDVTFGANWYSIGPSGLSQAATGDDAWSVMVGMNLPIYRQKLAAGLREAQWKAAGTAQRYEATWDEVRAEVQTLHAQAVEHDRIVKILDDDILPKSKQTLDLSIEAYRVDRITFEQLIDNYETLLRHRLDYYRRLSQREQALAALERAVGCAITTWPIDVEAVPAGTLQ